MLLLLVQLLSLQLIWQLCRWIFVILLLFQLVWHLVVCLVGLTDYRRVLPNFHDNSLYGHLAFLSLWLMIFLALIFDYQIHLNREFFANLQHQTLMDQLLLLFIWLFSVSNLWRFYQILSHVFHLLNNVKVASQTWGLLLDVSCQRYSRGTTCALLNSVQRFIGIPGGCFWRVFTSLYNN